MRTSEPMCVALYPSSSMFSISLYTGPLDVGVIKRTAAI